MIVVELPGFDPGTYDAHGSAKAMQRARRVGKCNNHSRSEYSVGGVKVGCSKSDHVLKAFWKILDSSMYLQ
jgi:hypothetical protein